MNNADIVLFILILLLFGRILVDKGIINGMAERNAKLLNKLDRLKKRGE